MDNIDFCFITTEPVPDSRINLGYQDLNDEYNFVIKAYEDNYPTTNLEAQACGTPVITYDVGGSPESIDEGFVVNVDDVNRLCNVIGMLITKYEKNNR